MRAYDGIREEREAKLQRNKEHHKYADDLERALYDKHDPVDYAEDSHGIQQIQHVEHDDERIHLVLVHVVVSVMGQLNVLFARMSHILVIENAVDIMIVGHLRKEKLYAEEDDDEKISEDRALGRLPVMRATCFPRLLRLVLANFQLDEYNAIDVAQAEEQLQDVDENGVRRHLLHLI